LVKSKVMDLLINIFKNEKLFYQNRNKMRKEVTWETLKIFLEASNCILVEKNARIMIAPVDSDMKPCA